MVYYAWLKDNDEFPRLTSEKGWDDCKLDDDDNDLLDTTMTDDDHGWQIINSHKTKITNTMGISYADIVKRLARTTGPFQNRHVSTFMIKPKTKIIHNNNNNNNDDDENDIMTSSELYILRKSKSRRRYLGDHWILQHRVTVLTRLGYGCCIQSDDIREFYDEVGPKPLEDYPLDRLLFIHFWRYVCKEDPEPEVDRLRKAHVKSLAALTDDAYFFRK